MEHSVHLGAGHFVNGISPTSMSKVVKKVQSISHRNSDDGGGDDDDDDDDDDEFDTGDSVGKALGLIKQVDTLTFFYCFCYDFPFLFCFTLLSDPHSILFNSSFPFPHHFSTRLSSFPLSMTHKPWGLLPLLFPHCLTLSSTALWLVLTPFHLKAVPPLYFPSIWLVMTRPLSFTGLPLPYCLCINTL